MVEMEEEILFHKNTQHAPIVLNALSHGACSFPSCLLSFLFFLENEPHHKNTRIQKRMSLRFHISSKAPSIDCRNSKASLEKLDVYPGAQKRTEAVNFLFNFPTRNTLDHQNEYCETR